MKVDTWDDRLKLQADRKWENYKKWRIALDTARADHRYDFAGDFLYVEAFSSPSAAATVRFNKNTNDALDLQHNTKIETVFTTLYITNTAQAEEWIDIIVGIDFRKDDPQVSDQQEPQAVIELTHAAANTNVAPASQIANFVIIKAHTRNTDIAWIDFGQAAVQDGCLPLEPGDTIALPISNLDQINANFEIGGEKVWIVNLL